MPSFVQLSGHGIGSPASKKPMPTLLAVPLLAVQAVALGRDDLRCFPHVSLRSFRLLDQPLDPDVTGSLTRGGRTILLQGAHIFFSKVRPMLPGYHQPEEVPLAAVQGTLPLLTMSNVIDIGKLKGDRVSSFLRSLDERISLKHIHRRLQVHSAPVDRLRGPLISPSHGLTPCGPAGDRQGPHRDHLCRGRLASAPHL